jgi:flagellar basal body-associated protein FliL
MKKILLFIVFILILVVIFGGYFGSIVLMKDVVSGRAETMTRKYVANLYSEYSVIGLNCQGEDTDGDTYVSCDVRIRKGDDNSTEQTRYLSCPTIWKSFTGSTCKERPLLPGAN